MRPYHTRTTVTLLLVLIVLVGPSAAQSGNNVFRVGAPITNGRYSTYGLWWKVAYQTWSNIVTASGGINIGGTVYTLQLVMFNVSDDLSPNVTVAGFTNLLNGVYSNGLPIHATFVPYSSALAAVAAVTVYSINPKMIMLTCGAADPTLFVCGNPLLYPCTQPNRRRFPRLWSTNQQAGTLLNTFIMLTRLDGCKTVGIVTDPSAGPHSVCVGPIPMFANYGMKVLTLQLVNTSDTPTAQYMVGLLQNLNPDIVLLCVYDPFAALFFAEMSVTGYAPKGMGILATTTLQTPWGTGPSTYEVGLTGPMYTTSSSQLVPNFLPTATMTSAQVFNATVYPMVGSPISYFLAQTVRAGIALQAAAMIAGSINPDLVNAAMANVNEPSFAGPISFGPTGVINVDPLSVQYGPHGQRTIVAPLTSATGNFIFPIPSFFWRGCTANKSTLCVHGTCTQTMCACDAGYEGVTCSTAIPPDRTMEIEGLAIGFPLCTLGVAVLAYGVSVAVRPMRERLRAPKDPTRPCAMVITDIEGSSDLWSLRPDEMGDVIEAHHVMVRKAIEQWGAYEVKTVGDSFIIASKSAERALELSLQIQRDLHNATWPEFVNRYYLETHATGNEFDMWRGLRVRIGIHWAVFQISHDRNTNRFDYQGPGAKMCGRIEAAARGGQILCSETIMQQQGLMITVRDLCANRRPLPVPNLAQTQSVDMEPVTEVCEHEFRDRSYEVCDALRVPEAEAHADRKSIGGASHATSKDALNESDINSAMDRHRAAIELHPLVLNGKISEEDLFHRVFETATGIRYTVAPLTPRSRSRKIAEVAKAWKVVTKSRSIADDIVGISLRIVKVNRLGDAPN